jgi:small-conductance mechanosensitive channel
MGDFREILALLEQHLGLGVDIQTKLVITLAALLVIWLAQYLVGRPLINRIRDIRLRYVWRKTLSYLSLILSVIVVAAIWLESLRSLATYLGLLSAGLAIALKDPLTDLVGWIFILARKPFEIGDRIQIGEHAGDVIDLRFFKFTLMEIGNWVGADQSTGRVLHIPNSMTFTAVLANYTKGSDFIWNEIPVLITFESDWEKAKNLLEQIASEHTRELVENAEESFRQAANQYMLRYGKLSSRVYTSVQDSGVLLTIRYLCEPRARRGSEESVWEAILGAFAKNADIDFAYPTLRYYNNVLESKAAANMSSVSGGKRSSS